MSCPSCGESAPAGATWCEACGQELAGPVKPACVACGEREVADDGYCLSCGHRQPAERDHQVFADGPVVAVTDRGRRHRHNEDSVAIGTGPGGVAVLVVCDGVSSTPGSAEASRRAAVAARDVLVAGLTGSPDGPTGVAASAGPGPVLAPSIPLLLERAVEVAQAEASAAPDIGRDGSVDAARVDGGPPSSTLVAVVARPTAEGAELTTAWVGDSRAYWLGSGRGQRLSSQDHELVGSLVRWLGADSLDPRPDVEVTTVTGPGHVVVCSDGLWRYAAEPTELLDLVERLSADGRSGLDLASGMVEYANEQGGHDNITVALWSNQRDWPDGDAEPPGHPNEESSR
jgi:serine/threonine protein phosphatase PrpC